MTNEISNSDYQRSVTHFVYFCMNYNSSFIKIFDEHLQRKFNQCYNKYGANAVMVRFFLELDENNRQKLLDYVKETYTGYKL